MSGMTFPDQAFWLVCAMFYLVDNAVLHTGRELLLTETFSAGWRLRLPVPGYHLGGRALTLLPPWVPFLTAVRLGWLGKDGFSAAALGRTRNLLRLHQRRLAPVRVIAGFYFVLLFVAGPVQTYYAGLGYALMLLLPLHFAAVVMLGLVLGGDRSVWQMGRPQVLAVVFECAVCPGYFANICRRVSLRQGPIEGDAIAVALDQGRLDVVSAGLGARIDLLLEDLAERDELRTEDALYISGYQAHLDPEQHVSRRSGPASDA